jgi:hypothetical protein
MAWKNKRRRPAKKEVVKKPKTETQAAIAQRVKDSKEKFLTLFLEADGNISLAVAEAGISRDTHYEWMKTDPEYAAKIKVYQTALEDREKQMFLLTLSQNADLNITKAAKMLDIDRGKHYEWLKDEKYAQQFKEVQNQIGTTLEAEAFRRAVTGTLKPVFYQGDIVGHIREYSDALLIRLMEAHMDQYKSGKDININNNMNISLSESMAAARERWQNATKQESSSRIGTD